MNPFIRQIDRAEQYAANVNNLFLAGYKKDLSPEDMSDEAYRRLKLAIKPRLKVGDLYFQVVIPNEPLAWSHARAIKHKFAKDDGIRLQMRLSEGNLILFACKI